LPSQQKKQSPPARNGVLAWEGCRLNTVWRRGVATPHRGGDGSSPQTNQSSRRPARGCRGPDSCQTEMKSLILLSPIATTIPWADIWVGAGVQAQNGVATSRRHPGFVGGHSGLAFQRQITRSAFLPHPSQFILSLPLAPQFPCQARPCGVGILAGGLERPVRQSFSVGGRPAAFIALRPWPFSSQFNLLTF
jgi:hypothetical protein